MKKVLFNFLTLITLFSLLLNMPHFVHATENEIYDHYLTYKIEYETVTIVRCDTSKSGSVEIPSQIDGYPVTKIQGQAFKDCTAVTSINIPEGITDIGDNAFWNCASLTSITIPNSVAKFGISPFADCYQLESITMGDEVTCLDTSPDSDIMFQDTAYYNNDANWERGLLYVGKNLVRAKTDITGDCVIREGTKSIARLAFDNCAGITSVTIPDTVTSIIGYAFSRCSSMTSVNIPDSVTHIGFYAFDGCSALTSIYIPDSVTDMGNLVFNGCSKLSDIYCEPAERPSGWRASWDDHEVEKGEDADFSPWCDIHWGYSHDDYTEIISNQKSENNTTATIPTTIPENTEETAPNYKNAYEETNQSYEVLYISAGAIVGIILLKTIIGVIKKK